VKGRGRRLKQLLDDQGNEGTVELERGKQGAEDSAFLQCSDRFWGVPRPVSNG